MTREEVQRASERVDAPKQQIYNDILVISDPQKAAEDKIKVDMARRKAALPSKIACAILLLFLMVDLLSYIAYKCGVWDTQWHVAFLCLTAFPAIFWFAMWASVKYIPYSANTQYWLATAKSNVHKMHISPASGGRMPWPATLHIVTKRENGKTKEENISLGYLPHYCDDIHQDVVDLTLDDEDGVWFTPASRKRAEFDQKVMSIKTVVKYYKEGTIDDYLDDED